MPFLLPSAQVKLEKVDPYYMVHPDSLVDVSKDSRLTMTQDEADAWLNKLREYWVMRWGRIWIMDVR